MSVEKCNKNGKKKKKKTTRKKKKKKKKKSSPIRWAKRPDSGSSETWEWNPKAEEEISLHAVQQERSLLQQDLDTIEAVNIEKEDTVGELQKEFDGFRKESKKTDDEIDQTRMAREESINGHPDGSADVESTQATWGSNAEYDGKIFDLVDGLLDCLDNAADHSSAVLAVMVLIAAELDKMPDEPSLLKSIVLRKRRLLEISERFNPDGFDRLLDISERFNDNADRLLEIVDRFYSDEARPRKRRKGTQPTQGLSAQTRNRYRRFMRSSRC